MRSQRTKPLMEWRQQIDERGLGEDFSRLSLSRDQRRRLKQIVARPVEYIGAPCFDRCAFMARLMRQDVTVRPHGVLTGPQEQILFQQLNYARYRMHRLRQQLLSPSQGRLEDIAELLRWRQREQQARNQISTGNMKLVFALAQRGMNGDTEWADLVGEGSVALLQAIDRFDWTRGYKFSTYAWRAIEWSLKRARRQHYRYRRFFPVPFDPLKEKDDHLQQQREEHYHEQVRALRRLIQANLADLSAKERLVVHLRFGLHQVVPEPLTLKQTGETLGLSKERARQIQNRALAKLRAALARHRSDSSMAFGEHCPVAWA